MEDISRFKCPYIPKDQIWQAAENFRDEFWPESTLPIDIERIVEKRLNLNIEPEHGLLSEIDIDAYLRIDLTGIVVDYDCYMNEKYMNRLRFSFAHELGHFFLHKDIYSTFSIDDSSAWKDFMLNIPDREYGFFEYQANEFAGRTLVPRGRLLAELKICLQKVQEVGMFDLVATDPSKEFLKNQEVKTSVTVHRRERRERKVSLLVEMTKQLNRITEAVIGAAIAAHSKFEAESKDSGNILVV